MEAATIRPAGTEPPPPGVGVTWPASRDDLEVLYRVHRWSMSRIGRLYGRSHATVGQRMARLGLTSSDPSKSAKADPIGRDDAGMVKLDDGSYMRAVKAHNVAPPEELTFRRDLRRLPPPPPTSFGIGCAAGLCAGEGER